MDARAYFLDISGERMFVSVARPAETDGAVVICPSLLTDALAGYRAETLLARSLAARGHTAIRMHYRGTGHSDGDGSATTFASMVDDALRAADEVTRPGGGPVCFAGTRLGALVAAAAAAHRGAAGLLLWEPATEAEGYFREAVRGRLMRETVQRDRTRETARSLFGQLHDGAAIDVLGYPLTPRLYRSFAGGTLAGLLDSYAGATRAVHFDRSRTLREALAALAATHGVEVGAVPASLDWWLLGNEWQPPEDLVRASAGWLAARAAGAGVPTR